MESKMMICVIDTKCLFTYTPLCSRFPGRFPGEDDVIN